jgi:hypothetical protein
MTKNMTNLPRLELTENPDKKSDFIIFRKSIKNKNTRKMKTRKMKTRKMKNNRKSKNNRKRGLFNLFL